MRDWTGNNKAFLVGAAPSNHSETDRANHDYYATDPKALKLLLQLESFSNVWECACGNGHLSEVLKQHNIHGRSSDLLKRDYECETLNFLHESGKWDGDIITNPPYKYATEFVYKSLQLIPEGNKIAMFLKIQFTEGKSRKELFKLFPPKIIYISSSRLNCAKNGNFEGLRISGGSAVAYAWFIWEKGFTGDTILRWFN